MKASVYIATSLDGFIARCDGGLDWLPGADGESVPGGEDFGYQAFMDSVDHMVIGRKTFELVLSFGAWPYEKPVTVLSKSLKTLPDGLPSSVELKNVSPGELVQQLGQRGVQSLYVDGGQTIQGFLHAGLIHELILTRVPVLLGEGTPLFGPVGKDVLLEHIATKSFSNGFVQSVYQIAAVVL